MLPEHAFKDRSFVCDPNEFSLLVSPKGLDKYAQLGWVYSRPMLGFVIALYNLYAGS